MSIGNQERRHGKYGMNKMSNVKVPYTLAVYNDREIVAVNKVLESHKTMIGEHTKKFEENVANLFGKKHGIMVNSGSSANIIAFDLLNLPQDSEIITPIVTFSTVVAPIVRNNLVPVFADVEIGTYQIKIEEIESLITPKTKALMIPSLIGNIPDYSYMRKIADEHNLWLIEDSCDTLGAKLNEKPTGEYSHISTTSFYGSHIITAAGGGGMICVNDGEWDRKSRILRGWGRTSEVTGDYVEERFKIKLDGIPYDSKFIFEDIGYNFLPLEISAAFGLVQLEKLNEFSKKRQQNFDELKSFFGHYENFFYLPEQSKNVKTNWLAFPLTIKDAPFSRIEIVKYLEQNGIQTRPLFTGNILRQPGFKNINKKTKGNYPNANLIMERSFLIGCHQGIEREHMEYLKQVFKEFLNKY